MRDAEAIALQCDEFVDGVATIRYHRDFATEEDAVRDLMDDLFFAKFDKVEHWAADMDSREVHEQAWRIHDRFVEADTFAKARAAYDRLVWLLANLPNRSGA